MITQLLFNALQTSFLSLVSNLSTLNGGTFIARLKQFDRELDRNWRRIESSLFEDRIQFLDRLTFTAKWSNPHFHEIGIFFFSGLLSRRILFKILGTKEQEDFTNDWFPVSSGKAEWIKDKIDDTSRFGDKFYII